MGMDILEHYELWTASGWHYLPHLLSEVSLERNYDLFRILGRPSSLLNLEPLAYNRGLPADASAEVKTIWHSVKDDPSIFGASWISLAELVDYDWDKIVYEEWEDESWCIRDRVGGFLDLTLPYLQTLVDDPRDLRMVFWFGS